MFGNNKNSKMKTKNKSTPPLTPKSSSSTLTTIESETPVTTPYASTTSSSKQRVEELLEMISIQENKIDRLTKRVTNLVQMLRKAQSCNLIAINTSELLKMEVDKLKQYSRRWCFVISGVELPPNKFTESAEEIEEKVRRIIETNLDISREDFDYKLENTDCPLVQSHQTKKIATRKPSNIICKFRTHHFREYLFARKKDILNITNKKINFHVSLTKYRLDLLHETNTYVSKNASGEVKFCFADSHGNLKIKFSDTKNVGYDSFQSFLEALVKELGNRETEQQSNHDREREGDE